MKVGDLVKCDETPKTLDPGTLGVIVELSGYRIKVRWPNGEIKIYNWHSIIWSG